MVGESISQEFRLKNIDEKRNYLIEEIKQKELTCTTLNYIEHFII